MIRFLASQLTHGREAVFEHSNSHNANRNIGFKAAVLIKRIGVVPRLDLDSIDVDNSLKQLRYPFEGNQKWLDSKK